MRKQRKFCAINFSCHLKLLTFCCIFRIKNVTACILILLKWQNFVRTSSDVFSNNFANYYHCIRDPLHCVNWTFFISHNFSFLNVTLITKFDFRAWHKSKKKYLLQESNTCNIYISYCLHQVLIFNNIE